MISLFDARARELVLAAQSTAESERDRRLVELIAHLSARCELPQIRARYASYAPRRHERAYPVDSEGYARSFDPLEQERELVECWQRHGLVVARQVVSEQACAFAVARARAITAALSGGRCEMEAPDTYANLPRDPLGEPILTRGFFEVYHDRGLADLRQSLRLYLHHVLIWGRADLWSTFDRYGVKLPGHRESFALPLHVDQNPRQHPGFTTIQGILALQDCPLERGTFIAAPGSAQLFHRYLQSAPERGEYVELLDPELKDILAPRAQPLALRATDIVTWDSRTTHANSANLSDLPRFVALIAAGPQRSHDAAALAARREAYQHATGFNARMAMMHASKKPRYHDPAALQAVRLPERLTALGRRLYGIESS